MEAKKSTSADLARKSGYFFSIGLVASLLIIITAFEWQTNAALSVIDLRISDNFDPIIEIPPTDIPPVPIPRIKSVVLEVIPDNKDLEELLPPIIIDQNTDAPVAFTPIPSEPEIEDDFPYVTVEESAGPKGGMQAFYKFVGEKIKYPAQARRMGIEGRVFVEFVINKDGSLSDVKAIKGIGAGCDEEAVRIVQSAPAWNPGKQRGKTVKQRYTLPIIFKLG